MTERFVVRLSPEVARRLGDALARVSDEDVVEVVAQYVPEGTEEPDIYGGTNLTPEPTVDVEIWKGKSFLSPVFTRMLRKA